MRPSPDPDPVRAPLAFPAFGPRRGAVRARTWWGRAWLRAVQEAAFSDVDLRAAVALARGGEVGAILLDAGSLVAAVGPVTAAVRLPVLDVEGADALVEVLAAHSLAWQALLDGDLPHPLVEHAEEAGVELLPDGGAFAAGCTCTAWRDPCPHALALLLQTGWLLDADPFVLLRLRGLTHHDLAARVRAVRAVRPHLAVDPPREPDGLDVGLEAALRAAALLRELDLPPPR